MNDMDRSQYAAYGLRSWVLQRCAFRYEVILTLFNNRHDFFAALARDAGTNCDVRILTYPAPAFFNISIANNLGLAASRGKYVFFCNSDVIHASGYLAQAAAELERLNLHYACGARMNLSSAFTRDAIRGAASYTWHDGFDALVGLEWGRAEMHFWGNGSPWMLRRDTALAIGGFDPEIVCYEERNVEDRAMHYLHRLGLQGSGYAFTSIYGYHLHHPRSELYQIGAESRRRVVDVRNRLQAASGESRYEMVASGLDDCEGMLRRLYAMPPPPVVPRPSAVAGIWKRIQSAAHALFR
jgi:hypothetical protein